MTTTTDPSATLHTHLEPVINAMRLSHSCGGRIDWAHLASAAAAAARAVIESLGGNPLMQPLVEGVIVGRMSQVLAEAFAADKRNGRPDWDGVDYGIIWSAWDVNELVGHLKVLQPDEADQRHHRYTPSAPDSTTPGRRWLLIENESWDNTTGTYFELEGTPADIAD